MERAEEGLEYPVYGRCHDITVDEVRECVCFAHLTDVEVQEMIDTLKRFTEIVYHHYIRQQAGPALMEVPDKK